MECVRTPDWEHKTYVWRFVFVFAVHSNEKILDKENALKQKLYKYTAIRYRRSSVKVFWGNYYCQISRSD